MVCATGWIWPSATDCPGPVLLRCSSLLSGQRPIFLSSAPSRWAGCPLLCATTVCNPSDLSVDYLSSGRRHPLIVQRRRANWKRPARGCCFWATDTSARRAGSHFPGNAPSSTCGQPAFPNAFLACVWTVAGLPAFLGVYLCLCQSSHTWLHPHR